MYLWRMKREYVTAEGAKSKEETDVLSDRETQLNLILWNDEINTFDWVIETLVDICNHTREQAEQCAYIIHTKGKYAVKKGDYATLEPMRGAIVERGINATIEAIVS